MPQQIHWTSFGIPYIVEFSNVSFVPRRAASHPQHALMTPHSHEDSTFVSQKSLTYSCSSAASSSSSFCHISHCMLDSSIESRPSISRLVSLSLSKSLWSPSSFFKRKQHKSCARTPSCSTCPKIYSNPIDTWCSIPPHVPKPLPSLPQQEHKGIHVDGLYIQFATPPSHLHASSRSRLVYLQMTISSAVVEAGMDTPSAPGDSRPSTTAPDYPHGRDSLFRGTYGQVMVALKAAGLVATPCVEGEFSGGVWARYLLQNDPQRRGACS